jgi:uncharacterized repeat protein (TIGR01451 family)
MFPHRFANFLPRLSHLMPLACLLLALPAQAEGSKDLISSGGDRPYLEYRNDSNVGIPRRSTIKVFARVGETINLGSSAIGMGAATILYKKPTGGASFTCGTGTGGGLIPNLAAENSGLFTPCTITVAPGEDGIWEVEFTSPDPSNTAYSARPPITLVSATWTQTNNSYWIAAWDITVRNSGGTAIPGRVFSNYLALNLGDNGASLSSKVYIQTHDGYNYTVDMNGLDPFGFIFFANNKGFRSQATNNPIYRSLQLTGKDPESMPPGYSIQLPFSADNSATSDFTHKIFFSQPDSSMPPIANAPGGSTWLYQTPQLPLTPSAPSFVGSEGTPGQAGSNPLGGFFQFTATVAGPYEINLDLNENGTYGDGNDRTLLGTATSGLNKIFWDGKDGNQNAIPAGNSQYDFQVQLKAGEIHFPFIDPENNPRGLIIERINPAGTAAAPASEVMYDDRYNYFTAVTPAIQPPYDYSLCSNLQSPDSPVGSGVTPTSCYGAILSRSSLGGMLSTGGAHSWDTGFGDRRGMDTWANYPSAAASVNDAFQVREADLSISKTDGLTTVNQGATLTYTIVASNLIGPSDAIGATVTDTIPTALTNVTWTCTATTGSSCPASGAGDINATVNLLKGGSVTFTVTAQVSNSATGVITNIAKVLRPKDVNDPTDPVPNGGGNNTATDTTTIVASPLTVTKAVALVIDSDGSGNGAPLSSQTATPGDVLEYTIVTTNPGASTVNGVILRDSLPSTLTYFPGSLKITTGPNAGSKTDITNDDQADVIGTQIAARLGTNGTAAVDGGGSLTANTSTTVTFRARINDPTGSNQVSNQAIVSSTGNPDRLSDDPSTTTTPGDPTNTKVGPRLRLVKRITGIKKFGAAAVTLIGGYNDLATDVADNATAWPGGPANYLFGVINGGQVPAIPGLPDPKDEIEYTIYFLADGPSAAQGVKLCDFIPANQNFVTGSITQRLGTVITPIADAPTTVGGSGFYVNGAQPAACPAANNNSNGAVFISPGSVTSIHTTPTTASGYFRFRATVK